MLRWLATLTVLLLSTGGQAAPQPLHCGWFENPTPANAWLTDRIGRWTIAVQGGHQARGEWPQFKDSEWVKTNVGSYGYGCACMRLVADNKTRVVQQVFDAAPRPLATCRADRALKEPENPLR